MVFSKNN